MNLKLNLKSLMIGGLILAGAASAADTLPAFISFVFQPGTPIKASEVNQNFANLSAEIGKFEAAPLKDASVTAPKLATQNAAASGKFLAYNGGSLTWADGTSGTVGPQGMQGPKGDTGPKGDMGPMGGAGPQGPKGDTGSTGAKGDPGPASAQALKIETVVNANQSAPGNSAQFRGAVCPAGKVPISGGYNIITPNNPTNINVSKNYLDSTQNAWLFQIQNYSNDTITYNVYVTCISA